MVIETKKIEVIATVVFVVAVINHRKKIQAIFNGNKFTLKLWRKNEWKKKKIIWNGKFNLFSSFEKHPVEEDFKIIPT